MDKMSKRIFQVTRWFIRNNLYPLILLLLVVLLYSKLFFSGKIPFPGDLLVGSYFPWLDYYKIPVQNPLISDVFSQLYLWKHVAIDIIRSGQWPLWNPYSLTGTPLLANYQSATLYPLNILLLLPKNIGWGLFIFSQTLIATFSMYFLLSKWLQSHLARATGAIIYSLAGLMTTWLELGTAVHAIAWLPLSFFFIEQFINTNKIRYILLLSLSLALPILAGNAQVTTYTFILSLTFAIYRLITIHGSELQHNFSKLRRIIILSVPFFLSIGLTSIQLLPSLELLQKSVRSTDSYIQVNNFGLLPFGDFLKFFSADFFGNPVTRNYWGFLNYFETSGFIGSVTLVLVIFTFLYLKKTSLVRFFLFFLGLSLVLLFQNPLSKLIYQTNLPLLTTSYASRILFVTVFTVSILSAFSVEQIVRQNDQYRKLVKCIYWSLAFFVGVILGIVIAQQITQYILNHPPLVQINNQLVPDPLVKKVYDQDGNDFLNNIHVAFRNSIQPLFLLMITFICSLAVNKVPKVNKTRIISILLVCLISLDLGKYFLKFNPFVDQNMIFPTTPAIDYLKVHQSYYRIGREHAEVFPPNTWTAYKISSLEGYDPLYLNQYGKYMHFLNGGDPATGGTGRYAELSAGYKNPFIDSASVKYFIAVLRDNNGYTPGNLINYKFNEAGYKRVFEDKSTAILENPKVMERVYLAQNIIQVPLNEIYTLMNNHQLDPHTTVALTDNLDIQQVNGEGKVKILSFSPNQVDISTESKKEEVLVLADQYDEGWKANIDGRETKISRANLIFRAIKIPAGVHQIMFYYWPPSFELGMKIFLASLAIIIVMFSISYFRKIL